MLLRDACSMPTTVCRSWRDYQSVFTTGYRRAMLNGVDMCCWMVWTCAGEGCVEELDGVDMCWGGMTMVTGGRVDWRW